jgi:plasmid maintenance system antidote protein VapI
MHKKLVNMQEKPVEADQENSENPNHSPGSPLWNVLVGNLLRAWRLRQRPRITQEMVAEVLEIARNAYSAVENGGRALTLEESVRLRRTYGISLEALLSEPVQHGEALTDLLRNLAPEEQQKFYEIMYQIAELLAKVQQQRPEETTEG